MSKLQSIHQTTQKGEEVECLFLPNNNDFQNLFYFCLLLIFITAAFVLVSFFAFYRHRAVTSEQFVIYHSYHFYSNAQVLHKIKSKLCLALLSCIHARSESINADSLKFQLFTARKKDWWLATADRLPQAVTCQHCDIHYVSRHRTHNLPLVSPMRYQ